MSGPMLIVTLPLPSRRLSPNGRYHWAPKARAVKKYRADTALAARAAMNESSGETFPWHRARLRPHFFYRDNPRRDSDNMAASLKAARDGLQDAGLIENDSQIENAEPVVAVDRKPRVELWITAL